MNLERLAESTDPPAVRAALAEAVGRCAFDVGANHGQSARVLAAHFDQVVSFEPCHESYVLLEDNVPANVMPQPYAITARNGPLALTEAENSIRSGQLTTGVGLNWGRKIGMRQVQGFALDTMCLMLKMVPDFVKIDVEGHEAEVVKGGLGLFAGPAPTVLIEVHNHRYEEPIRRQLHHYDFEVLERGLHPGLDESEGHFWMRGEAL